MDRNASRPRDLATERQSLLASPLVGSNRSDRSNGLRMNSPDMVASDSETLLGISTKLSASACNFFLSGVATAAIGVCMDNYDVPEHPLNTFPGHDPGGMCYMNDFHANRLRSDIHAHGIV